MPPADRPAAPRHVSSGFSVSAPTTITSVAAIRSDPRTPRREWSLFEATLLEGEEHPLRRTTSSLSTTAGTSTSLNTSPAFSRNATGLSLPMGSSQSSPSGSGNRHSYPASTSLATPGLGPGFDAVINPITRSRPVSGAAYTSTPSFSSSPSASGAGTPVNMAGSQRQRWRSSRAGGASPGDRNSWYFGSVRGPGTSTVGSPILEQDAQEGYFDGTTSSSEPEQLATLKTTPGALGDDESTPRGPQPLLQPPYRYQPPAYSTPD